MDGRGLNGHANGHAPSPTGSFEHKAGTDGLAPRSSGDSFESVNSNDSFRSAWSKLQSSFGERLSPEGPLTASDCLADCPAAGLLHVAASCLCSQIYSSCTCFCLLDTCNA